MIIDNNNMLDKISSSLKPLENNKQNSSEEENLLKGESAAVIAGAKVIEKSGYKVDKYSIDKLKTYLSEGKGTVESKLEALEIALKKDMPLKESILSRISTNENLSMLDFLEDYDIQKFGNSRRKRIEKTDKLLKNIYKSIEKEIDKSKVKDKNFVEKSRNILKSSEITKISESIFTKELKKNISTKSTQSERGASDIIKSIKTDESLNKSDSKLSEFEIEMYNLANYLSASASIKESSNYSVILETKITQKLIDLKRDFTNLKNDLSSEIQKLNNEILSNKDKVNILAKNIEKLDNAIMKSEMSLYIDLKGERELIKISSDLQIAKSHLESGEIKKAENILTKAHKNLETLKYEPSIKKAFAIGLDIKNTKGEKFEDGKEWIKNVSERYANSEKSPLSTLNYLRRLGINMEAEELQNTYQRKDEQNFKEFKDFSNLKEILHKMISDKENSSENKKAVEFISQLEGNQLKNKITTDKNVQTVEIKVPINLNGRIKNVKVFIKSPQKMLKLDWENFEMFFVLSSDNLGQLGIKVSSIQRNLSVKIINDEIDSINSEREFKSNFKTEIEDLGYRLTKLLTESWQVENKNKRINKAKKNSNSRIINQINFGQKGFDLKI